MEIERELGRVAINGVEYQATIVAFPGGGSRVLLLDDRGRLYSADLNTIATTRAPRRPSGA